jgi:hypothetical protein
VERCPECCCEIDDGRCEGCGVEFSQSEGEDDVDDRWEDESEASGHEVFGLGNVDLGEIMEVEPVDLSDDDSIGLLVDGSDDQSSEDQDVTTDLLARQGECAEIGMDELDDFPKVEDTIAEASIWSTLQRSMTKMKLAKGAITQTSRNQTTKAVSSTTTRKRRRTTLTTSLRS